MARHAVELGDQHPDPHRPLGDLVGDPEELLGGHREDELVEERAQVVHPSDVGAALQIGQLLALLLHPGVQVADDRLAPEHRLALQLEHQAQHSMGARVLRTHVDDHRLILVGILRQLAELGGLGLAHPQHRADLAEQLLRRHLAPRLELLSQFGCLTDEISHRRRVLELDGDLPDLVVLAQRVPLPVLRHEDAGQVGMVGERDPEHVVHLALERLGAGVDVEQARHLGSASGTCTRRRTRRAGVEIDEHRRRPRSARARRPRAAARSRWER